MNKKHLPLLAAAIVTAMLAAGCTALPGKAENAGATIEQAAQESMGSLGEAIQSGIGDVAAGVQQAVQTTAEDITDHVRQNSLSKELTVAQDIGSARQLKLDHSVGGIEIKQSAGNEITVKATVWTQDKDSHRADREAILDQAELFAVIDGDVLSITVSPENEPGKDLWNWAQKKYGFSEFGIDYSIEVPENMELYDISNDVGNITLSHLAGTFKVRTDVGEIALNGAVIEGGSSITSDTGSIKLDVAGIGENASLKAKTDVGAIRAAFSDQAGCRLTVKSDVGGIKGASKGTSDVHGGGAPVSLITSVGSITVEQ